MFIVPDILHSLKVYFLGLLQISLFLFGILRFRSPLDCWKENEKERHVASRKSIFGLELSSLFFFIIFRFWRGLYARFDNDIHPRESIADHVCALNDQNESLQDHIRLLSKVFSYDHFDTNQLNHAS